MRSLASVRPVPRPGSAYRPPLGGIRLWLLAACAALAGTAVPAGAQHHDALGRLDVVSGRSVPVTGGEQACFRLRSAASEAARVEVHLRFSGPGVPAGWVQLDGRRGPGFAASHQVAPFRVEPGGIHRLTLHLERPARLAELAVISEDGDVEETECTPGRAPGAPLPRSFGAVTDTRAPQGAEPPPAMRSGGGPAAMVIGPDIPAAQLVPMPPEVGAAPQLRHYDPDPVIELASSTRMNADVDGDLSRAGDSVSGRLSRPVRVDGQVILPRGTSLSGRVLEVDPDGARIALEAIVTPDGTRVPVDAVARTGERRRGAVTLELERPLGIPVSAVSDRGGSPE